MCFCISEATQSVMMKHFVSLESSIGDQLVTHGPTRRLENSNPGSRGKVYLPWKDPG